MKPQKTVEPVGAGQGPSSECQPRRLVGLAVASLSLLLLAKWICCASPEPLGSREAASGLRLLAGPVLIWTGSNLTAFEVLEAVVPSASCLLIVTAGTTAPSRREESQPFLTTGANVVLPTEAINSAVALLEGALGRRLFPLRIEAVDMAAHYDLFAGVLQGLVQPIAIWEVGSGLVLVDKRFVQTTWADPKMQHMTGSMATHLFRSLADAAVGAALQVSPAQLAGMMGPALTFAVAAAFAAAPPLWFCIVCPAVLGLLAPLVINIALNQIAGYLCVHMALPDDQCFDLLVGALGLGFVLALASAIPIFYVCQMPQCAHHEQHPWSLAALFGRKGGAASAAA